MSLPTPPMSPGGVANEFKFDTSTPLFSKRPTSALITPPYTPLREGREKRWGSFDRLSLEDEEVKPSSADSRKLSDNELSYFLPSRADGVNDMYLHHTLDAPDALMTRDRILHLWSLQLLRHPLLASQLLVNGYEEVQFTYAKPAFLSAAIMQAEDRFIYLSPVQSAPSPPRSSSSSLKSRSRSSSPASSASSGGSPYTPSSSVDWEYTASPATSTEDVDLIDSYLNGPRSLSNERLGMLCVKHVSEGRYEVMLCSTHFLGDGMALHTFMNEFYTLLESKHTVPSIQEEINSLLAQVNQSSNPSLPLPLEDRLPKLGNGSTLAGKVGKEELARSDSKLIGGQCFPGAKVKKERRTVVPTFPYTPEETKRILKKCKENGVTIAHAMFALCNLAWARCTENKVDPCLIYSALNLRPNLLPVQETGSKSYFHLAVGYFNIILPTLLPSTISTEQLFWHRARETKRQTIKAVKSPFLISRSRETNRIRRERAVKWAKIDDEDAAVLKAKQTKTETASVGLGLGIQLDPKDSPAEKVEKATPAQVKPATPTTPQVSQKALMGLSMLGNLDGMYAHAAFPDIVLTSLTTGSRQRQGGLLLFAYTFAGKLWMSLGYDVNGFKEGVIEGFWEEVQSLVKEVLLA